jgi:predicted nucleic-acid-binding protein
MIGLDTNVIARLVVADDPEQTERAAGLINSACSHDDPGYINQIVLSELVWVLSSVFGYGRDAIADVVEDLMASTDLLIENSEIVRSALAAYTNSNADFTDALIAHANREHGCENTATFDRKAAKLDGFVAVP